MNTSIRLTPEQIIAAFDEILDYVYGRQYGRDNPHASDKKTAEKWIADGLTLHVATAVFYHRMSILHEKFMREFEYKSRENIPHSLKVFDENIYSGIRRMKAEGQIDTWELEESKWRSRLKSFFKFGSWIPDQWGPRPNEDGCRAPRRLLAEMQQRSK